MAFAVFGATLSSIAQLLAMETMGKRALRTAHAFCVGSVLIAMAGLWGVSEDGTVFGAPAVPIAIVGGAILTVAAIAAIILETGWKRLTPSPLLILGVLVASGAPFES